MDPEGGRQVWSSSNGSPTHDQSPLEGSYCRFNFLSKEKIDADCGTGFIIQLYSNKHKA